LLKEAWETVRKLEMLETEFRAWEGDQAVPRGDRIPPFTRAALGKAIGNGVPLPMGRAVAQAVAKVVEL